MIRFLVILPLCLIVAPGQPVAVIASRAPVRDLHICAAEQLPSREQLEHLARTDVVGFLRACVLRYQKEVHSYRAVLVKEEFLGGKLQPAESVEVAFRDEPYSVMLRWRGECAGRADRALYVRGSNDDKTLARPKNRAARMVVGDVVARDPDGPDSRASGRVSLREFGLKKGTERALIAWEAAQNRGNLHVEYLGIRRIAECDGRECYVLKRTCVPPEEDGVVTIELTFDVETWLQTGSVLTTGGGQRMAAYHFRDVVINPTFAPDQFERAALTRE